MQQVITEKQARQVLGGRQPHMPVEYETAIKALAECITLDEAKYWDNKADALAAWAKIYHSPEAERKAKQLKLHAYRRLGALAEELRPQKRGGFDATATRAPGSLPGPVSLLKEHGINHSTCLTIRQIARIPKKKFDDLIEAEKVLGTKRAAVYAEPAYGYKKLRASDGWRRFQNTSEPRNAGQFRSFCRANDPVELARSLHPDEAKTARAIIVELQEWLDAFEQALPK